MGRLPTGAVGEALPACTGGEALTAGTCGEVLPACTGREGIAYGYW